MRTIIYLDYIFNLLDANPDAEQIYQDALSNLAKNKIREEESATREIKEMAFLQRLKEENQVSYAAFYDSIKYELQRARVATTEIKERDKIVAKAENAFNKIKDQYRQAQATPQIAAELQKHKEQAAQLIAKEWKKRHDLKKSRDEGYDLVTKDEFLIV